MKISLRFIASNLLFRTKSSLWERYNNTASDISQRLGDAEILVANYLTLDAERLSALPKLRHIIVPSVGYDWVDVACAKDRGITVSNCPLFSVDTVAEHTVALTLSWMMLLPPQMNELELLILRKVFFLEIR